MPHLKSLCIAAPSAQGWISFKYDKMRLKESSVLLLYTFLVKISPIYFSGVEYFDTPQP